jgi:methionyl aminopeptidase
MSASGVSKLIEEIITSYDEATPAFLGYNGFPAAACVSINEEVVHGVPRDDRIIQEGDIVSVDCGVNYKGHFTDACRTVAVSDVDKDILNLINSTEEALNKGIQKAQVGARIGDISNAIQKHVERRGLKVHLEFTGHGIGFNLHQLPCIPNYGPSGRGEIIREGMCLAIEPVIFMGNTASHVLKDGWTVVSRDSGLSAHFEDTIIVTSVGPEVITRMQRF